MRWLRSAAACSLGGSTMIAAFIIAGTFAPASQAVALRAVPVPDPVSAVRAEAPSVAPTSDPSRIVVEVMGFQNLGTRNPSDPIERVGIEASSGRSSPGSSTAGSEDIAAQDRQEITKDVLRVANVTISDPGGSGRALRYPVRGQITSQFGLRFHPVLRVWKLHSGTDFGVSCGTPVGAAAAGTVTFAGFNVAYGNRIIIDHGTIAGLRVSTTYNHLSGLGVHVGQKVGAGQGIALSGTTGWSTGCHLHLEVLVNGQFTNPMPWLTGKPANPSDVVLTGNVTNHSDSNSNASAQGDRQTTGPVKTVRPKPVTTTPTQTASGTRPPSVPASSTTPAPSTPAASHSGSTPEPSTSTESTPQPSTTPVNSPSPSRTSTSTQSPTAAEPTAATGASKTQPAAQTQPAQTQPAQTQPAQTQPAQTQPAQTQPAMTQPKQPPAETAETAPPAPEPTQTDATKPSAADPAETP